jgi:pimeloyl-[acyl-carrier protein] methyl ester esterase
MKLVFVHGWGFDRHFWLPLANRLPGEQLFVDLGFRGEPQLPDLPEASDGGEEPVIAVGHSLGSLWLLHERPFHWDALIAINGFRRFSAEPEWPGVAPRLLARMRKQFTRDPRAVWDDFRIRCGDDRADERELDANAMLDGLDWLAGWDAREQRDGAPVLALAARNDEIVPAELSSASFANDQLHWHSAGDHLLPRSAPDWCAAQITPWLAPFEHAGDDGDSLDERYLGE